MLGTLTDTYPLTLTLVTPEGIIASLLKDEVTEVQRGWEIKTGTGRAALGSQVLWLYIPLRQHQESVFLLFPTLLISRRDLRRPGDGRRQGRWSRRTSDLKPPAAQAVPVRWGWKRFRVRTQHVAQWLTARWAGLALSTSLVLGGGPWACRLPAQRGRGLALCPPRAAYTGVLGPAGWGPQGRVGTFLSVSYVSGALHFLSGNNSELGMSIPILQWEC